MVTRVPFSALTLVYLSRVQFSLGKRRGRLWSTENRGRRTPELQGGTWKPCADNRHLKSLERSSILIAADSLTSLDCVAKVVKQRDSWF